MPVQGTCAACGVEGPMWSYNDSGVPPLFCPEHHRQIVMPPKAQSGELPEELAPMAARMRAGRKAAAVEDQARRPLGAPPDIPAQWAARR